MTDSTKSQVLIDRPLVAMGLFSLAMMIFSSTDGAAKYLSSEIAPQQIIFLRYVIVLTLILLFSIYQGRRNLFKTEQPKLQILRGLCLASSGLLIYFALKHLPLELCAAISFASPLFVTALSIPLLTRLMRDREQALTVLAWSSLVGVVALSPLAWSVWLTPNASQWTILILLGIFNGLGQYLVIRAFMLASASLLAPFSYSIIIWSMLIGLVVFNSFPDAITLVGTTILIAAGLYIWHREKVASTLQV